MQVHTCKAVRLELAKQPRTTSRELRQYVNPWQQQAQKQTWANIVRYRRGKPSKAKGIRTQQRWQSQGKTEQLITDPIKIGEKIKSIGLAANESVKSAIPNSKRWTEDTRQTLTKNQDNTQKKKNKNPQLRQQIQITRDKAQRKSLKRQNNSHFYSQPSTIKPDKSFLIKTWF